MRPLTFALFSLAGSLVVCREAHAENTFAPDPEFEQILSLDIADLTVTTASRREQSLSDVPAAVYVITQEDIRRMGATSIPEALRVVPGLQVAQVRSNQWAVSARGFNGALSNKLLVLIDGRSIYTPVFSGTYWDDKDTMLEDIDRIEVIRGPGASIWGANAVNGVINIITKNSAETQGNLVSASTGTEEYAQLSGRHGGKIDDDTTYRVYAKSFRRGKTEQRVGGEYQDDWYRVRSGFRLDGKSSERDSYSLQGDAYGGEQGQINRLPSLVGPSLQTFFSQNDSYGGNILGHWKHDFSTGSQAELQVYIDHYTRDEAAASQHVTVSDIDFQHHIELGERNQFVWGLGYRHIQDYLVGSFSASVPEENKGYDIFSAFVQDEYALVPKTLFLTLGSKFEHNPYTGFEAQPTGRLLWHATDNQTLWGSVSRAVRIPSVLESEADLVGLVVPGAPPTVSHVYGSRDLHPEELLAYEIGYRIQPSRNLSLDAALFYNDYNHLITIGPMGASFASGGTTVVPFYVVDSGEGTTRGVELAATWNATSELKLSASYSYLILDLNTPPTSSSLENLEASTPRHQVSLRSYWDIAPTVHWDNAAYFVDDIAPAGLARSIGDYLRFDTRLAWEATPGLELSLIGRNLLDSQHPEFVSGVFTSEIERSFLLGATWRF